MAEVSKTQEKKDDVVVTYIKQLTGWMDKIPNLHWAAPADNTHVRLDELKDIIDGFRDSIAEDYQGIKGSFRPNEIVPVLCDCLDADCFIREIKADTLSFYANIPSDAEYVGIKSECESFIHSINKYTYLFSKCNVIKLS